MTVSNLSPGMYKFRLTVTDDAGQTGSTEVSVLVLTPEQSLREYMITQQELCVLTSFIYLLFNCRWNFSAEYINIDNIQIVEHVHYMHRTIHSWKKALIEVCIFPPGNKEKKKRQL